MFGLRVVNFKGSQVNAGVVYSVTYSEDCLYQQVHVKVTITFPLSTL